MTFWERWKSDPKLRSKVRLGLLAAALADVLALFALTTGADWYYDPRRHNPAGHVIVYSTRWCPVCERLRQCLRLNSVPFEERDIEATKDARAEWSALDGSGVPLTLAGQELAYGMREKELRRALGSAGYRIECPSVDSAAETPMPRKSRGQPGAAP